MHRQKERQQASQGRDRQTEREKDQTETISATEQLMTTVRQIDRKNIEYQYYYRAIKHNSSITLFSLLSAPPYHKFKYFFFCDIFFLNY